MDERITAKMKPELVDEKAKYLQESRLSSLAKIEKSKEKIRQIEESLKTNKTSQNGEFFNEYSAKTDAQKRQLILNEKKKIQIFAKMMLEDKIQMRACQIKICRVREYLLSVTNIIPGKDDSLTLQFRLKMRDTDIDLQFHFQNLETCTMSMDRSAGTDWYCELKDN